MHLEVPESLEEGRAELEEERQKYMEILDYQGGWRVSIFMGNKWQREAGWELGKSKEEDRHSRRAEGKKKGDRGRNRETDKPNEVEKTSMHVGEGTRSRRVLNRLDKELRPDTLIFSFTV